MINPAELLFSVDEDNHPIKPQPRALSHETGIWHRAYHVWVVNEPGQILCQQRSLLKDSNPGRWEPFFGGHLAPNQKYSDSAAAEVYEELGLGVNEAELHFFKEYKYVPGTEYQGIFVIHWNGDAASL
jgi:isopentenyldiphosphate isomerase